MKKIKFLLVVFLIMPCGVALAQVQNRSADFLFNFAAYGDSRNGYTTHEQIVSKIIAEDPYFVLHTGDFVNTGSSVTEWDRFEQIVEPITSKSLKPNLDHNFYPAVGNHESPFVNYFRVFSWLNNFYYYAFDYQNFHFMSLSTETPLVAGTDQYNWVVNELEQASVANKEIIVFFHRPVYGSANYGSDMDARNNWVPLFEQYGVSTVFNGHSHIYERTYPIYQNAINNDIGITYVITGGGGAPLYPLVSQDWWMAYGESVNHFVNLQVTASKIYGTVINKEGVVLDTFDVASRTNNKYLISAPAGEGKRKKIRQFTIGGEEIDTKFFPFSYTAKASRNGVRIASGDLDLDGYDEIVVGAGNKSKSWVKIFETDGFLIRKFRAFKYKYKGGVDVACGDIDGDGRDEIAVSKLTKKKAKVKVFRYDGKDVYFDRNVFSKKKGGATVTFADIDGDGNDELVVGTGEGVRSKIKLYDVFTNNDNGELLSVKYFPFKKKVDTGVDIAGGDVDGDGVDEIGVSRLTGKKSKVKVYEYNSKRTIAGQFRAFNNKYKVGVNIEMFDIDSDGQEEIITGMGGWKRSKPKIRVFKYNGDRVVSSFLVYKKKFRGGVMGVGINDQVNNQ